MEERKERTNEERKNHLRFKRSCHLPVSDFQREMCLQLFVCFVLFFVERGVRREMGSQEGRQSGEIEDSEREMGER